MVILFEVMFILRISRSPILENYSSQQISRPRIIEVIQKPVEWDWFHESSNCITELFEAPSFISDQDFEGIQLPANPLAEKLYCVEKTL